MAHRSHNKDRMTQTEATEHPIPQHATDRVTVTFAASNCQVLVVLQEAGDVTPKMISAPCFCFARVVQDGAVPFEAIADTRL